jgi:hypothetical protein
MEYGAKFVFGMAFNGNLPHRLLTQSIETVYAIYIWCCVRQGSVIK